MNDDVGYKRPPRARSFAGGRSGNPRGRPKGRKATAPHEAVFGRVVKIVQDGVERKVNAAEALLLVMAKQAYQGKTGAALELIKVYEQRRGVPDSGTDATIYVRFGRLVFDLLGIGKSIDPLGPKSHLLMEPSVVEEALSRLGERRLTIEEQKLVVEATWTPHKVRYPDWWTELPKKPGRGRPRRGIEPPPRSLSFFEELEDEFPEQL